jgi:catechol 2,3-dioxygenase-like lactoylglutathione lyase family enzyme
MTETTCSCCGETRRETVQLLSHREIRICYQCLDWLNGTRAKQVAGRGGGVRIVGTEPIFAVTDVARAIDHYQRLGFRTSKHDESYAFAHRDDLTIHLAHGDSPGTALAGSLYLHVDDAAQLADDWRKAGTEVAGPQDYDYGKREGSHVDPDGNRIRFGSPVPKPK